MIMWRIMMQAHARVQAMPIAMVGWHRDFFYMSSLDRKAATRAYNVASVWEKTASLSDDQLHVIESLRECCSQRPLPSHIIDDRRSHASSASTSKSESVQGRDQRAMQAEPQYGTLEDAVLRNTNQFHKWHSDLEAAMASEMEEKYKRYADLLNSHLSSCDSILGKVTRTLELFDLLVAENREVAQRSKALHTSCEQIVREKDQLEEFADALRAKLKFFDEFESVYTQFNQIVSSSSVSSTTSTGGLTKGGSEEILDATPHASSDQQLLSLLRKLDDCKSFVATNPQYADSGAYMAKFRQLQAKAMGAVRSRVQQVLKSSLANVQASVQEALGGSAGSGGSLAEGAEVSLLYVRFRAAAEPGLKPLFREVESRAHRPEYLRLLEECQSLYCQVREQWQSLYCQARLNLIQPLVQQRVQALATQALPLLTRNGCEHLLRVGQMEAQLFEQFFPSSSSASTTNAMNQPVGGSSSQPTPLSPSALAAAERLVMVMEPLCTILYDVLRPLVVHLQDVDELCELVDILKHEVLGDQLNRKGPGAEALSPTLGRTLADVQSRLIYRSQAFIKDEVSSYQPTLPDDLDYPAKLIRAREAEAKVEGEGEGAEVPSSLPPASLLPLMYPPVQSTLVCLSKLYRAVDVRTFGGLAQEAISACTLSIQQAARQVAQRSGPLDAQLFTARHLLFLREQIAPFGDAEFASSSIDLDFSHLRDHMRRILSGGEGGGVGSLFALSSSNAVVKMLGTSGPRVLHYKVDSKKDLEKQLKAACESIIMALTKTAVEPLLGFITKVTAVRVQAASNPQGLKPIREQAFASPQKVSEMIQKVNEALAGPLPDAASRMRLYLPSPGTHAVLFKPVKVNLHEAHAQVAALLKSEYSPEEAATIPLKSNDELTALLEAMDA